MQIYYNQTSNNRRNFATSILNNNLLMNHIAVGIGEVLWDVFPNRRTIGGATANFAYHTAQFGLDSYIVSAVGNDALGDEAEKVLKEKGLKTCIQRTDSPTGTVTISLNEQSVPKYDFKEQAAWDNIPFNEELVRLAKQTSLVCFGSLAQRHTKSRSTIRQFLKAVPDTDKTFKVFDINLRQNFFNKELLSDSLKLCNILKINDEELSIISGIFDLNDSSNPQIQSLALLKRYNIRMLILTCGINGSYVITPESVSFRNTPKVETIDTVGAGDAFTAAFCSALYHGKNISEAHELAVEVAAYVCTQYGSMPIFPDELKCKAIY